MLSVLFLERQGIDDPVGAISVHGVGGLWGLIAVGLFADGTFGDGINGVAGGVTGLFYGATAASNCSPSSSPPSSASPGTSLAGGAAFLLIGRCLGSNRVPPEVEVAGLDIPEMGTPGYPEFITTMSQEQVTSSDISAARARMM